jgi:hypothetical protein
MLTFQRFQFGIIRITSAARYLFTLSIYKRKAAMEKKNFTRPTVRMRDLRFSRRWRFKSWSSGLWSCVMRRNDTTVSGDLAASILKRLYRNESLHSVTTQKTSTYICVYFSFTETLKSLLKRGTVVLRRPFVKFVESPYHSESELCGGAVTVSFSK